MVKRHLKRLSKPKNWKIQTKRIIFVIKPNPGAHSLKTGLSLGTFMKELVGVASTTREVKTILNHKTVLVDGKRRKDYKLPVGIMDSVQFIENKENYRIVLNEKGNLKAIKIEDREAGKKICKITGKSHVSGGKIQISLFDSRNINIDPGKEGMDKEGAKYTVGDSLLIELPGQKVAEHFKFEKGAYIYLIGGKHSGNLGVVEDIKGNNIIYRDEGGEQLETLKRYAFVVGKDKPAIKIAESSENSKSSGKSKSE